MMEYYRKSPSNMVKSFFMHGLLSKLVKQQNISCKSVDPVNVSVNVQNHVDPTKRLIPFT